MTVLTNRQYPLRFTAVSALCCLLTVLAASLSAQSIAQPAASTEDAVQVPTLAPLDTQVVHAGERYALMMRAKPSPDAGENYPRPLIAMKVFARGMRITPLRGGWYQLHWTPAADQLGEHRVLLITQDVFDASVFSQRWLDFDVLVRDDTLADSVGIDTSPWNPEPVDDPDRTPAVSATDLPLLQADDMLPVFDTLPTQIVSAGHVLSLQVRATIADGSDAVLNIDRLPANGSFDKHRLSGRVFYWRTSDSDQGEHQFQLTAFHPRYPALQSTKKFKVIVGDPTGGSSAPTGAGVVSSN